MDRNYLLAIDSSIHEKIQLRQKFDISEEGKELHSIKSIRRRDMTPISTMTDDIFNSDLTIDELNNKRERLSNDVYNIKRNKHKLKRNFKGRQKIKKQNRFRFRRQNMYIALNVSYKTRSLVQLL